MRFPRLTLLLSLTALLTVVGCSSDDPANPGDGNQAVGETNEFFGRMPAWDDYANNGPDVPPVPAGEPTDLGATEVEVEEIQEDGSVAPAENVRYVCRETPYRITTNPEEIVMFSPDESILWPGAFIQGNSYDDDSGLGAFAPLTIDERAPIDVVIKELPSEDSARRVETPSLASVTQAVRGMIGNATRDTLDTPSSISFSQETYHSESSWALSVRASGRYLGFEGSAEGDRSRKVSETTVTAKFVQKMYTVSVPPPSSPAGWFSDALTQDRLQFYVDQGLMGANNVPVYLAEIVYGRMMMVSVTSSASAEDIRGSIRASYNSIGGGASGSVSAKQEKILERAKISIVSVGGPADATQDMIRDNNLGAYFTRTAQLSTAVPLSFIFRTLDGRIAKVTESTEYTIRECTPIGASGEPFVFVDEQTATESITTPARTVVGDFDGDQIDDIAFCHTGGSLNETVVALAEGDGTFSYRTAVANPQANADGWSTFEPFVGDFDGDGLDDIAWNSTESTNVTYVGLSDGNGGFTFGERQQHPSSGWGSYQVFVGDVGGDGIDDLIFNTLVGPNRTYVFRGQGTGAFEFLSPQDRGSSWGGYEVLVGDINADNRTDIVFNIKSSTRNGVHYGFGNAEGRFTDRPYFERSNNGWQTYSVLIGNVGGGPGEDLVFPNLTATSLPIHMTYGSGSGWSNGPLIYADDAVENSSPLEARLADVDGDGREDFVYVERDGTLLSLVVGLATESSSFLFTTVPMEHPAVVSWEQYQMLTGDFDGDGRDDLLWNLPAVTNRTFVALGAGG